MRIDWLAVLFAVAFGLWLAADTYSGFYLGFPLPMRFGFVGVLLCLAGIFLIGLRDWRTAALALGSGVLFTAALDRVWKYAIHPTEVFKLVAVGLLLATPLIAVLGVISFWRVWKRIGRAPARRESAPSVVSR
jgi:hypothetical protein